MLRNGAVRLAVNRELEYSIAHPTACGARPNQAKLKFPMSHRFRITRRLVLFCLAAYWILLATGTHLPGSQTPSLQMGDKSLHSGAFFGLAFLLSWCVQRWRPNFRQSVGVLGVLALYAATDEFTQGWVPARHPDLADWFADMWGAGLGIAGHVIAVVGVRVAARRRASDATEPGKKWTSGPVPANEAA